MYDIPKLPQPPEILTPLRSVTNKLEQLRPKEGNRVAPRGGRGRLSLLKVPVPSKKPNFVFLTKQRPSVFSPQFIERHHCRRDGCGLSPPSEPPIVSIFESALENPGWPFSQIPPPPQSVFPPYSPVEIHPSIDCGISNHAKSEHDKSCLNFTDPISEHHVWGPGGSTSSPQGSSACSTAGPGALLRVKAP